MKKYLFGVTMLGVLLRLAFLTTSPLWFDELSSTAVITHPWQQLLSKVALDTHPPFYFILLKLWATVSFNPLLLRVFSLIFAIVTIPLVFHVIYKLANTKIATLTTLLFAFSPLHIYYSVQIRMYALLVFETLILIWLTLNYQETKNKNVLIAYLFIVIATLYTHYYGLFVILTLNCFYFVRTKLLDKISAWITAQGLAFLAFLPWLLFALKNHKPACWCFSPVIGIPMFFASFVINGLGVITFKDILSTAQLAEIVFFTISILGIFLLFSYGVFRLIKKKEISLLILFFVPMITAVIIGFFIPLFSPRALIFLAPFFYMILSYGVFSLSRRTQKIVTMGIILIFCSITIVQILDPFYNRIPESKKEYLTKPFPLLYAK